jgi:hypothetical protein
VSPVYRRGPGGGYWYYVLPALLLLGFAIAALATSYFGLKS